MPDYDPAPDQALPYIINGMIQFGQRNGFSYPGELIKTIIKYLLFLILVWPAAMIFLVFFWQTPFICREYIPQTGAVGALVPR